MAVWQFRFWYAMAMLCLSTPVLGTPQNGWWWNPDESGRGFYLEWQGDQLFVAGYFYEADGRATWMIAGDTMTGPQSFSSRLLSFRGGQSLMGSYVAPSTPSETGRLTLEFTGPDRGTLTWPGGTIPLQRHVFALGEATFQPTGWWWNPDESGRGFSIEVQGDTLFMAAFMYDTSGNPVWYISSGKLTTPRTYTGTLLQVSGGQTMGGSYRPPAVQVPIGSVEIEFASEDVATITLSDQRLATRAHAAAAGGGAGPTISALPGGRRISIVRQMARPGPLQATPRTWTGEISKSYRLDVDGGKIEEEIVVSRAVWYRMSADGVWPAHYLLQEGVASISYFANVYDCATSGEGTFILPRTLLTLQLQRSGAYSSWQDENDATISVEMFCAGQTFRNDHQFVSVDFEITESALWRGRMVGYKDASTSGYQLVYRWFLSPGD